MRKNIILIIQISILSLILAACAGKQTPPEGVRLIPFKAPAIGTKLVSKVIENGEMSTEQETVSKMEIEGVSYYYFKDEEVKEEHVFDTDTFNWKGLWSVENNHWLEKTSPNFGTYRFPLWAGKTYRASCNFSRRGGWSGQLVTWVKVGDWETITVPAGTFEVLPITQKNKHFKAKYWYSPELGMSVKYSRTSKSRGERSSELVSIDLP